MTHYTINPIDWVDSNDGWYTARNVIGTYLIGQSPSEPDVVYIYAGAPVEREGINETVTSVDEAKARCQSIHDERVKSLLTPQ